MATRLSTIEVRSGETRLPLWSKKTLFVKTKHSDEWHQQVDFTAGQSAPSDHKFPWAFVRKHTDNYIKKKGKITQTEIDVKLATLIESHERRDIAIAACAHAMTPSTVRAMLNVELNVTPSTFFGLEMHLQSLIAANSCSAKAVTALETLWAKRLIPYATSGTAAAGRFLEGVCVVLQTTDTLTLQVLPDFAILAKRAIKTFATHLEGMKLRCQWVAARAAVLWLSALTQLQPSQPGRTTPEDMLDALFPIWRIWARWRPNLERLDLLSGLHGPRRAVLPDLMALEGPDFINGTFATLRDGLISQYSERKPLVRFRGLVVEVSDGLKEGLVDMLARHGKALDVTVRRGDGLFKLFVELTILRPIAQETLQLLEAVSRFKDATKPHLHNAVREIWSEKDRLGGRHIVALQQLICTLDDPEAADLRKVSLRPWFVQGIEKCIAECQSAVRVHITSGLAWTHLALELHAFCAMVKSSKYCLPLLNDTVQKQLDILPSLELLKTMIEIYTTAGGERITTDPSGEFLRTAIESCCIDCMLQHKTLTQPCQRLIDAVVEIWNDTTTRNEGNVGRRTLAILVSKIADSDIKLQTNCLRQIVKLPPVLASNLTAVLQDFCKSKQEMLIERPNSTATNRVVRALPTCNSMLQPESSCNDLAKLLANLTDADVVQCWKSLLYTMLENLQPTAIIDHFLDHLKAKDWIQFMLDLSFLFADIIANPKASPPSILRSDLHQWVRQLSANLPAVERLAEANNLSIVKLILKGGDAYLQEHLLLMLEVLTTAKKQQSGHAPEQLMHEAVGKLVRDGTNAKEIADFLAALLVVTPEGLEACERVWNAGHSDKNIERRPADNDTLSTTQSTNQWNCSRNSLDTDIPRSSMASDARAFTPNDPEDVVSTIVIEVMMAGWLQSDHLNPNDKSAIGALATILQLEAYEDPSSIPGEKLDTAATYFAAHEAKLIKEAERLEGVQRVLKQRDPRGTQLLLAQLGVEDVSPLDEEIESLPVEVASSVEKHAENEVELSFSLASLTELQRNALGITTGAHTLLVRLFLDYTEDMPPLFCVHLDTDYEDTPLIDHTPYLCLSDSQPPVRPYCCGKPNTLTWQVSRGVHRHLQEYKPSIAGLHHDIKKQLMTLTQTCIVCGRLESTRNCHRAIPCSLSLCTKIWSNVPLGIRIPEIRSDPFAVDMILTTVYAAAMAGRTELLPGCPITNITIVKAILNTLPSCTVLREAVNLPLSLKSCHKDAERLLVWALTNFRGFISTATGICKIPGMPTGTHQFVLANANPALEIGFAAKLPRHNPQTKILFHGTSPDRLPAILAQGLRIFSGTNLQRTGAAHGKGIYLAEEPSTSFSYSPSAVSWRNSGLSNMRMLLGCEVAGSGGKVTSGIHVITDEKSVMVRYVFLLTRSAYPPIAGHIVPAMGSAVSALRKGTV